MESRVVIVLLLLVAAAPGCTGEQRQTEAKVREDIQRQLDKCVKAVTNKDIELYMEMIPEDFVIYDQGGERISREKQREYTLRDWSVIDRTLSNRYVVDSLRVDGDSAIVFTSQRWERLMYQRDGKTTDTVLTTQLHTETWKRVKGAWLNYDIKELGGEIFINGKAYIE